MGGGWCIFHMTDHVGKQHVLCRTPHYTLFTLDEKEKIDSEKKIGSQPVHDVQLAPYDKHFESSTYIFPKRRTHPRLRLGEAGPKPCFPPPSSASLLPNFLPGARANGKLSPTAPSIFNNCLIRPHLTYN